MKDSVLLKYLLNSSFLCIDESEIETIFTNDIKEKKEKLENILTKEQMKEVNYYKYDLVAHMFNIRTEECFKMFYLGIALGMEVRDFINEQNKEE